MSKPNQTPPLSLSPEAAPQPSPPFHELLRRALTGRLTGLLELREAGIRRRITLLDGLPVAARSNLLREHLLRFLLQHEQIDQNAYTRYLGHVQSGRWQRGHTLVRAGVLSEQALKEAELRLAQQILLICFGWKRTQCHFQPVAPQTLKDVQPLPLDPFGLYEHWLTEHVSPSRLRHQLERFHERTLRWSVAGVELQRSLSDVLARHPLLAEATTQCWPVSHLIERANPADRDVLGCALLSLFHLGMVQLSRSRDHSLQGDGRLMSLAGDLSTSPESSANFADDDQGNTLDLLRSELARVQAAKSSYEVLGLTEGAVRSDIERAYDRFERFYAASHFTEAELPEVRRLTALLRQSFAQAHRELTEGVLASNSASLWSVDLEDLLNAQPQTDGNAAALANVLFEDGRNYLKLGEYVDARNHFQQAIRWLPFAPRYKAYLGWAMFLCAVEDDLETRTHAQTLLREAVAADPLLDEGYVLLGHIACRAGRFERGAELYKRALTINPNNREAQQALQPLEAG